MRLLSQIASYAAWVSLILVVRGPVRDAWNAGDFSTSPPAADRSAPAAPPRTPQGET
jgi:hypothetical protein